MLNGKSVKVSGISTITDKQHHNLSSSSSFQSVGVHCSYNIDETIKISLKVVWKWIDTMINLHHSSSQAANHERGHSGVELND